MAVVKLTQEIINRQLHCPEGKRRVEFCDSDAPGLYVLVSAGNGTATFYLRYKDASGKTCHENIGRTSEISLADARKQAKALKAELVAGRMLKAEPVVVAPALTFSKFFEEQYMPHVKTRKRSWDKDEGLYKVHLKREFGELPLTEINRQRVQAFHNDLRVSGLAGATCDHYIKLLRHALNLAVEWDLIEQNPIARVRLFNDDNKVEHYLNDAELSRLLAVLNANQQFPTCQLAIFLLSTGARLNEALQAKWCQIDRHNRVWTIPASNSKSKRVRSVPLNDSAIDLLNRLGTEDEYEYLFINRKTGKPPVYVHKYWRTVRKEAELPKLRLHDLRHQYASFLVNAGRTLYEVQQILGHSDSKVTQRYAHLSTKTLQDAANSASMMIQKSMKVSQ